MKKAKNNRRLFLVILCFLLLTVTSFCGFEILQEHNSRKKDIENFAELAKLAEIPDSVESRYIADKETKSEDKDDANQSEESGVHSGSIFHDFPLLISMNSDCIGWLSIDNTNVNYPVMCTPEWPQKYLRMNFYQQYSDSGVPFLDSRCTPDSDNLIIYGHNMKNGTMFSSLVEYLNEGRIPSTQRILFETEDGAHEFEIFAVAVVDKSDPWYSFINSGSEDGFNETVQRIISKASIWNGEIPRYCDRLLTLSTCYGSSRNSRLIIIAKEVNAIGIRQTENDDSGTDGEDQDEGFLRHDPTRVREVFIRPLCCWRQLPIRVGHPGISPVH